MRSMHRRQERPRNPTSVQGPGDDRDGALDPSARRPLSGVRQSQASLLLGPTQRVKSPRERIASPDRRREVAGAVVARARPYLTTSRLTPREVDPWSATDVFTAA